VNDTDEGPRRLRRAEAVLARRTSRVVLVLEKAWNDKNVAAVLRTAEAFGVQHVWIVREAEGRRRVASSVTTGSHDWLSVRTFKDCDTLLAELRAEGIAVWATDLAEGAEELDSIEVLRPVPERVALVLGREVDGVSETFLAAADRRLCLPMRGFTQSLNLSVATALVLQRLFDADPTLVGSMPDDERAALRATWYARLGGTDERKRGRYVHAIDNPPAPLDDPRPTGEFRAPRLKQKAHWRRAESGDS
jgi:tRNA (guanosine-2'-O-)-methyltransferase